MRVATRFAPESSASCWWSASCWCRSATASCRSGLRARLTRRTSPTPAVSRPAATSTCRASRSARCRRSRWPETSRKVTFTVDRKIRGGRPVAGVDQDRHDPRREVAGRDAGRPGRLDDDPAEPHHGSVHAEQCPSGSRPDLQRARQAEVHASPWGADGFAARRDAAAAPSARRRGGAVAQHQRQRRGAGAAAGAGAISHQGARRPSRPGEPAHRRRQPAVRRAGRTPSGAQHADREYRAMSQQLSGFVADNRREFGPALQQAQLSPGQPARAA